MPAAAMTGRALVAFLIVLIGDAADPTALTASSSVSAATVAVEVPPLLFDADADVADDADDDAGADDDSGSAPPVVPSVESVLQTLKGALLDELHVPTHQWVNALVAFILGAVLVLDGDRAFQWAVLVTVFFVCQALARYEVEVTMKLEPLNAKSRFVGVLAGLCGALAALRGIEGVMLAVAALFGTLLAYMGQSLFISHGYTCWSTNQWLLVVWYSVLIQTFVFLWGIKKHKGILGIVTPFLGAPLVVSAVSWLLTVMSLPPHDLLNFVGGISPERGSWVDFLVLLISSTSDDKGLFANSPYNFEMTGQVYPTDRILGRVWWALVAFLGIAIQLRRVKKARAEAKKGKLSEALLGDSNSKGSSP